MRDTTTGAEPPEEPPEPTSAAAIAPRQGTRLIEEIIVTAQKREEGLRDVPMSLSVLDDEFMAAVNITDFRDASLYAPNVDISSVQYFPDIRIRGLGTALANKAFEQSVGLVLDGVPYGRLPYWDGPLFDLERVEILRGPQGTLFGKNTTAGLVNVVTRKPTDETTGFVDLELGELDRRRFEAALGGPLIANFLNFRITGLSDERDGFMENTTAEFIPTANDRMAGRDRKGLRTQLAFPSLFGADLVVGYERVDFEILGGAGWELFMFDERHVPLFQRYDPNVDLEPGNFVGSIDHADFTSRTTDTFVANAGYDIGGWAIDAVAGHSLLKSRESRESDFSPAPIIIFPLRDENPQTTFESRLNSPSLPGVLGMEKLFGFALGRTDFTVGFFYQRLLFENGFDGLRVNFPLLAEFVAANMSPAPVPGPGAPDTGEGWEESRMFFDQTSDSFAGFSQINWQLTDRATLQYGMRFTQEEKKASWERVFTEGSGAGFRGVFRWEEFTARRRRSESALTPKVTARYDWSDAVNFYAGWGKGFKSGGFNVVVGNDDTPDISFEFEPERVTSWEAGSRIWLLDGLANLNLGLFRMDVTDLQEFTSRGAGTTEVENAGKARSQGIEADVTLLPTRWLTVVGALGLNHAKYIEFPHGTCARDREDTDGDGDERCDLSGQPLYRTPKWTSTVTGNIRFPLTTLVPLGASLPLGGVDLIGGVSLEYKDVHFVGRSLDPRTRQPSFFRVSANVGLGNVDQGWSLRLVGQNLNDVVTAVNRVDFSFGARNILQIPEPPRLIFGEFRWQF